MTDGEKYRFLRNHNNPYYPHVIDKDGCGMLVGKKLDKTIEDYVKNPPKEYSCTIIPVDKLEEHINKVLKKAFKI